MRQYPPSPPVTRVHIDAPVARAVPLYCNPVKRMLGSVGCWAMKLLHRHARLLFWLSNLPVPRGLRLRKTPPSQVHHSSSDSPGVCTRLCTSECAFVPMEVDVFTLNAVPPFAI